MVASPIRSGITKDQGFARFGYSHIFLIMIIICLLALILVIWKGHRSLLVIQAENGRKLFGSEQAVDKDIDVNYECVKRLKDIYSDSLEINENVRIIALDFDHFIKGMKKT